MRKLVILIALVLFCIIACKKDNNQPQSLIIGKWSLTTIHSVEYLGNVKEADTTAETTTNFNDKLQFNKDGSFINLYSSSGLLDTIAGNYKISGNTLSFSNYHSNYVFLPTPFPLFLPARVDSSVSISNQITQINSSKLTIHSESNLYDNASNINTRIITDQYYSK
ncbi:MAG: hypothetical protein JST50_20870 [Bacteroidetes bacterium]|jgi:hypothetical protein|nr:hypothetical protein [Bacteroidota bacterium]